MKFDLAAHLSDVENELDMMIVLMLLKSGPRGFTLRRPVPLALLQLLLFTGDKSFFKPFLQFLSARVKHLSSEAERG